VLGTKFQKRDAEKRLFSFWSWSEEWLSGICISSSCFTRSWYLETMVPVRLSYKFFPSTDIIGTLLCQLQFRYEYGYVYFGNDSNLLIVFYVQIMPDDFVMQLHRF